MLWFNSYWFVEKTKGISIDTTFNHDQSHLYLGEKIRTCCQLELAISVRIIHRLLLKFKESSAAADRACKVDGEVTNALM